MTQENRAFPLSHGAARALEMLQEAGHEAWIVGGCVRDFLLGIPPKDYDITTSALPEETKSVFQGVPVIETGIRHGTVTVVLEGEPLEITTYRVDGGYSDARHPDQVTFTRSLGEDAARRDFTMNAMAYNPREGLRDFFGGQKDVQCAQIRAVGDPMIRFQEDALRILRGLRFAAVLGFSLEPETEQAARRQAGLLKRISAERISGELSKLLLGKGAGLVLQTYPDILGQVIPELLPMVGFDQHSRYHCFDLLGHTARAVDGVPPVLPLRLAALLHDVGKPPCFSLDADGQGHFYGHARQSADMARDILTRLRFPKSVCQRTETLVHYHDSVIEEDPRLVKRWLNRLGEEAFFDLLCLQRGDTGALAPAYRDRTTRLDRLETLARDILAQSPCLTVRDLALRGQDLLDLGLRGPEIGRAQNLLLEGVLEGIVENEKQALVQFLEEHPAKKEAANRKKSEESGQKNSTV